MDPLGIVAGRGDLPRAVAQSAREAGRDVFVLALTGFSGDWVSDYPHAHASLGEAGKIARALSAHSCAEVLLAGKVERPRFSDLKLDAKGASLLPRVAAAALKGDDALLRILVDLFEAQGHRVVSVAEAAPDLIVQMGAIGKYQPDAGQKADIARGFNIVGRLGDLDVGQAAVVCDGLALAVEAAEGTDAMLKRVAELPRAIRGQEGRLRGVLIKTLKPLQDRKTDMPVIGVETVRNAAAAYLAGIAVQAGNTLILDRRKVEETADRTGIFVIGCDNFF